jgi:DNA invertase Pin-like site-specific DNA recombinase
MVANRKKQQTRPTPNIGIAVYLRTSSDETQNPTRSRARQRALIDVNVLQRRGMPVYAEYTDVVSGTTAARPSYQTLLNDAKLGKFSLVVVESPDRFGRDDAEALRAINELDSYGVQVVFANMPDLDPMNPHSRGIISFSFSIGWAEVQILSDRVKGGLTAKRASGGWIGRAPDGYRNVVGRTDQLKKHDFGRFDHWIELDPDRAPIVRYAWDLVLEDRLTLPEIAEEMHAQGYRRFGGQPYVEIAESGVRKQKINSLSHMYHNPMYAGWLVSEANGIPLGTIRGNWPALVTDD